MVGILVSLFGQLGMVTRRREPPVNEELEGRFRDLVATTLKRKSANSKRPQRLVLLIDEIDRCRPDRVVVVLDTLRTFLGVPRCVYVVPADREFLESAIQRELPEQTRKKPGPAGSSAGEYLEKIFQHQLTLPPLHTHRLSDYALKLVASKGGVWATARERGIMGELITVLLPTHVRNPRRAKALLNGFVSLYRSADSRRARRDDCPDPQELILEIAKLSTLQLEFPRFFADIRRFSQLATYLDEVLSRQEDGHPIPADVERRVRYFEGLHDALELWLGHGEKQPLGQDLLIRYLQRTAIVRAPRSDLVYMESPAAPYHLDHSTAEECLNLALDRQSDQLCALLAEHTDVIGSAVEYLSSEVRHRIGIDRDNILDSLLALVDAEVTEPIVLDTTCVKILAEQVRQDRIAEDRLPALVRVASHEPALRSTVAELLEDTSLLEPERADLFTEVLRAMVEAVHPWESELSRLLLLALPGTIAETLRGTQWDSAVLECVFDKAALATLSSRWVWGAIDSPESGAFDDFGMLVITASTCACASLLWDLLSICNERGNTMLLAAWLREADVVLQTAEQTELCIESFLYANHEQITTLAKLLEKGPATQTSMLFGALGVIRQWILEEGFTEDAARVWATLKTVWHKTSQVPDELPASLNLLQPSLSRSTQDNRLEAHSLLHEAQEMFDEGGAVLGPALLSDYASFVRNPAELTDPRIIDLAYESASLWPQFAPDDQETLNSALDDETSELRQSGRRFWHRTLDLASRPRTSGVSIKEIRPLAGSRDAFDCESVNLWVRRTDPPFQDIRAFLIASKEASPYLWRTAPAIASRLEQFSKTAATDLLLELASWGWPTGQKSLKELHAIAIDTERFARKMASLLRNATNSDHREHVLRVWQAWEPSEKTPRQSLARALTAVVRRRRKGDLKLAASYAHLATGAPTFGKLDAAMRCSLREHPELRQTVERSLKDLE